ncbi:MAG: TonB-dependent receptor plug domain-containing protein [Cyclobacteriaceae bacterium]
MKFVSYILATLMGLFALAQSSDTVRLDEVVIEKERFQRFSTGAKVVSLIPKQDGQSLSNLLESQPSVYLKNYGNGQLSSIAFRGTSAQQTNVLWHGVPANYPTLGQVDFSQWPLWMVETIALQPGSAGALYGSGSIGGTVLIDSEPAVKQSSGLTVRSEFGSFGSQFYGAKANYLHKDICGGTKVFFAKIDNDFDYKFGGDHFTQQNAANQNFGVQQTAAFENGNHQFSADAVFTSDDREIQPVKTNPDNHTTLETTNLRLALSHNVETENASLTNTVAYLVNSTLYEDTIRTTAHQYSLLSVYLFSLSPKIDMRVGSNLNYFVASSRNYSHTIKDTQLAVFTSLEYSPFRFYKASLNLRQSFYKSLAPFSPSFGGEFMLFENRNWKVSSGHQLSWGFRYPTLNELHWSPGGNPDLKPEESFGIEGGFSARYQDKGVKYNISAQGYKTWSKNWVFWIPVGAWSAPENLRNVVVKGVEVEASIATQGLHVNHEGGINYSYNRTTNKLGTTAGNQMIYVPAHMANLFWEISRLQWVFVVKANNTGMRYAAMSNSESSELPGFTLIDCQVRRKIAIHALTSEVGFAVKNLTDKSYENIKNLAMPGRNYQLIISIKL